MLPKIKRIVDESLLERFRRGRCSICGLTPCDPAHIKTVKSGGNDEWGNLLSLCRQHHSEHGQIGFFRMCEKYPFFRQVLAEKGWIFNGYKQLRRE